jgi:hypothetical protein
MTCGVTAPSMSGSFASFSTHQQNRSMAFRRSSRVREENPRDFPSANQSEIALGSPYPVGGAASSLAVGACAREVEAVGH